jgi:hypothetical protein
MTKTDNQDKEIAELDLRPINPPETHQISNIFNRLAEFTAALSNGLQRQIATNIGSRTLHRNDGGLNPQKHAPLTAGLMSRFAYQAGATYPSLLTRQVLTNKGDVPQYAITLSTTGVETTLGMPFEVSGSMKTLQKLGIEIGKKDLMVASSRAFLPFFVRNNLAWMAINSNTDDGLMSKVGFGALAGAISVPFHNIGMKAMEHSPNKTYSQTWNAIQKEVMQNPKQFFQGTSVRSASIATTAILLAPETLNKLAELYQKVSNDYYFDDKPIPPCPSTKPQEAKEIYPPKEKNKNNALRSN